MKNLKNLLNNENKTKIIGLLTILVALWLVLYLIPELFVSLFNTLLGNLILIITTVLVYSNNKIYGLVIGITLLLLYRFSQLSKESFTSNSERKFLSIQNTINRQKIFDMNIISKQASQEELDYFNKNGMWPWSQKVIQLYQEAIATNPYIRTVPEDATNEARKIYNQAAILRILSYQTKEGQMLLNGVLVPGDSDSKEILPNGFGYFSYSSGLMSDRTNDIIKCNLKDDSLERITYTGKGGIFNQQTKKYSKVDYNDLENLIPGFKFLSSPCNPCKAIGEIPDYSCPFKLNVKDKSPFISNVWQTLWNINDDPLVSQPSFLSENINPNEYPLLSELQTELKKQNKKSF
jgi:hypothetical protein